MFVKWNRVLSKLKTNVGYKVCLILRGIWCLTLKTNAVVCESLFWMRLHDTKWCLHNAKWYQTILSVTGHYQHNILIEISFTTNYKQTWYHLVQFGITKYRVNCILSWYHHNTIGTRHYQHNILKDFSFATNCIQTWYHLVQI